MASRIATTRRRVPGYTRFRNRRRDRSRWVWQATRRNWRNVKPAPFYASWRGRYRVFNPTEYRFWWSDLTAGPPVETDPPDATNATLPYSPTPTFGDGTWGFSMSYYNGVHDSGFLPVGPQGETFLRLDISGGAEAGTPPRAPLDARIEAGAGGTVRLLGAYYEPPAGGLRATDWAVTYTTDGTTPGVPPMVSPTITYPMPTGGIAILDETIGPFDHATQIRVRIQTARAGTPVVYSENPPVLMVVADLIGPTDGYADEVMADNPVTYWRLNEPVGTLIATDERCLIEGDIDPDGVSMGIPGAFPAEPEKTAAGFDGVTGNINFGDLPELDLLPNEEWSIETWFRVTPASLGTLLSKATGAGTQFWLGVERPATQSYVYATVGNSGVLVGNTEVGDGVWHHVVLINQSFNGGAEYRHYLHVDGNLDSTAATSGAFTSPGTDVLAGAARLTAPNTGLAALLTGELDEISVYRHVLSVDRILRHYRVGRRPA